MRPLFAALGLSLSVAVASAAAAPPPLAPLRLASPVLERGEVREAQTLLRSLGYDVGPIDGRVGPRVRSALTAFQRDSALAPTGQLDDFMLAFLMPWCHCSSLVDGSCMPPAPCTLPRTLNRFMAGCSVIPSSCWRLNSSAGQTRRAGMGFMQL